MVVESARPTRTTERRRCMSKQHHRFSLNRAAALVAIVAGVGGGSYGLASAASGGSTATTTTTTVAATAPSASGATAQAPWGHQRSDETLLTGDALAKVTAIAKEKIPGGTIVRVEDDADGHAAYQAHMTKADGTPVTVYVDKDFHVVSVESGGPGGHGFGGPGGPPQQEQQSQSGGTA
jgi:peptidase YpeB-like protein